MLFHQCRRCYSLIAVLPHLDCYCDELLPASPSHCPQRISIAIVKTIAAALEFNLGRLILTWTVILCRTVRLWPFVCHNPFPSPTLPNKTWAKGDLIKVSLYDYPVDWISCYFLFSPYYSTQYYDKHTVQLPHIPCIINTKASSTNHRDNCALSYRRTQSWFSPVQLFSPHYRTHIPHPPHTPPCTPTQTTETML